MSKPPQISYVGTAGVGDTWRSELEAQQPGGSRVPVDSAAWFHWLAAPTTTSFSYPIYDAAHGYIARFMTVRKERRQRGGSYWVAYQRCQGRVRKVYLGATSRLTQACLDQLASTFLTAAQDRCRPEVANEDS